MLGRNNDNNRFNINCNDNIDNNRPAREWSFEKRRGLILIGGWMKTYKNLWLRLCSFENLFDAYVKAKRGKSGNPKVQEFEKQWRLNLCLLLKELRDRTYRPLPLRKFVLRDPKTRTICVSDFRDRIVHHALINVLQPIFELRFIHDSYASRKGKGTLAALERFDKFKRQVSRNGSLFGGGENHQTRTMFLVFV